MIGVESAAPLLFDEGESDRRALPVLHGIGDDLVVLALDRNPGLHLGHREWEGESFVPEPLSALEEGGGTLRAPQAERLLPSLQREGLQEAERTQEMIGVEVREEDVAEREAGAPAHHLALCALAAVEEHRLPFARERDRREPALHGRARGGGAEELKGEGHRGAI